MQQKRLTCLKSKAISLDVQQGVIEYGTMDIYMQILEKFIEMTFIRALRVIAEGMKKDDWKEVMRGSFILKGSVGQIELIMNTMALLERSQILYESLNRQQVKESRMLIDNFHLCFDLFDEAVKVSHEINMLQELVEIKVIEEIVREIKPYYVSALQSHLERTRSEIIMPEVGSGCGGRGCQLQ